MAALEQEIASVIRFILDSVPGITPYYWDIPEGFVVPSVFFPQPELTPLGDTFASYTQRATRIVTDDISRSDARKIIQKVAALEDVRDIQKVCGTAVHALDTRDREGFSKSTFRLYGEGIRLTARQILLDAHAANNVNFQTDYDKRVEKIGAIVDGCSLLLEYLTICTEEGMMP